MQIRGSGLPEVTLPKEYRSAALGLWEGLSHSTSLRLIVIVLKSHSAYRCAWALGGSVSLRFAPFDSNCFEVSLRFAAFDSISFKVSLCFTAFGSNWF